MKKQFSHYTLTVSGPISLSKAQKFLAAHDEALTLRAGECGDFVLTDEDGGSNGPLPTSKSFKSVESALEFAAWLMQL